LVAGSDNRCCNCTTYYTIIMTSKHNKATGYKDFFVGQTKGEIKKVKALWSQVSNIRSLQNDQVHTNIVRRICAPIPSNQAQLVAEARGEKLESTFSSMLTVRIL